MGAHGDIYHRGAESSAGGDYTIYVDGAYYPTRDARVSVYDHGFLYGFAVFDTWCGWAGYVFKMEQHLDRLFRSLKAVSLTMPISRDELRAVLLETLRRNNLRDAYLKCVVTAGAGDDPWSSRGPTVVVFARPYHWIIPPDRADRGIRAKLASNRRTPHQCLDPKIKSTNYLNAMLALAEVRAAGYDDAIMLDVDGYVTEGIGYNLFIVTEGQVITPAEGVLRGITRETVFEICRREGITAREAQLTPYDLYTAQEAFWTSTAGGITPITEIDDRAVGDGKPGPLTGRISSAYWGMLERGEHGTPIWR